VTDTPEVLKRYAGERGADQPDWRFVTGSLDEVRTVVVDGFKQALEVQPETEGVAANVLHGSHFVLVDRGSWIRGYYRSDESGLQHLMRDARRLLAEKSGQEGAS
jgi:protein SCO1/2